MKKPIESSYWVIEDKFLAGEYPVDFLKESIEAGFKCFIDLTDSYRYPSYSDIAKNISSDAEVYCFPITNRSIPKTEEYTKQILDTIDRNLGQGRMVYLHCLAGIGRTGTIVGCWLARHGYEGSDALTKLYELWEDNPLSKYIGTPETNAQYEYVFNWHEDNI
jgi:hypothetical protein